MRLLLSYLRSSPPPSGHLLGTEHQRPDSRRGSCLDSFGRIVWDGKNLSSGWRGPLSTPSHFLRAFLRVPSDADRDHSGSSLWQRQVSVAATMVEPHRIIGSGQAPKTKNARVSSADQKPDLQLDALKEAGCRDLRGQSQWCPEGPRWAGT